MKWSLPLLLIMFSTQLTGQEAYFAGKILYRLSYEHPTTGEDITAKAAPYLGLEQHYYISGDNYKSYNEKGELTQLYHGKSRKYYLVNPADKAVMEMDSKQKTADIVAIDLLEGEEVVAGVPCKKLRIRTDKDETIYWYSSSVKVPFQLYSEHAFGNWNAYLQASGGALPLKYRYQGKSYVMVSTAVSIEQMPMTDQDFDVGMMVNRQ